MPTLVPGSARARRRVLKIGGLVVAAGAAAVLVYLLVPNHKGGITSSTPQTGPVQTVAHPKQVPGERADRGLH